MFLVTVLSYGAGILVQALCQFPLKVALIVLCLSIPAAFFLVRSKKRRIAAIVLCACFFALGVFRVGVVDVGETLRRIDGHKKIYRGTIIDAGASVTTVRLLMPEELRGEKALFRIEKPFHIGDEVTIFGHARELRPAFQNPHLITWRWIKRLEGTSIELKGDVLNVRKGGSTIGRMRAAVKERIDASRAMRSDIIRALTIGDTTGIDETTKNLFLRTGTSHILAISGSNVGIVCAFFFVLARFVMRSRPELRLSGNDSRYAAIITIPFAVFFLFLAGLGIPLIRATIMIAIFMMAVFIERTKNLFNTMAFSALAILVLYPQSLFSPSFQLTFTSLIFMVIATEKIYPFAAQRNIVVRWLILTITATISATAGTLPVVLYHFSGFNPFSVFHNLIAIPLLAVLAMPIGLVGVFMPWVGDGLLRVSGLLVELAVRLLALTDFGYIYPVIRPVFAESVLYFSIVLAILFISKRIVRVVLLFVLIPISIAYGASTWIDRFHKSDVCIHFIDVGLGDAMLIEGPGGLRMLVDTGGFYKGDFDVGKAVIAPLLLSKKIRTIDYLIVTHPHGDHIGGAAHLLHHFSVRHFVTGGYHGREGHFLGIIGVLRRKGIPLVIWKQGDYLAMGQDVGITVVHPDEDLPADNTNDNSLVLRITKGATSFLLTGDIGMNIEERLVLGGLSLRSDILKIPHHGSKYSSSLSFLRAVRPRLAVMSVGPGVKELPSHDALDRYRRLSIPLVRTDQDGYIRVCSDGANISWCGVTTSSFQKYFRK